MDRKPTNADELKRWMSDVESYRDKEIRMPEIDDRPLAIVVTYIWGDKVRLADDPEHRVGRVVLIEAGPCGVRYEVCWVDDRSFSQHHDFELEAAE